jgi:hypothetical protein
MMRQPQVVGSQRPRLVAQWYLVTDSRGRLRPQMRWASDGVRSSVPERQARPEVALIA